MNSSSLKRVLSLICVFALMIGMVSASALGAPLMTGEAVAEIPVMEDGPVQSAHVDVEAERPAVQVGAQNAPTNEDSAQLMAGCTCSESAPHAKKTTIQVADGETHYYTEAITDNTYIENSAVTNWSTDASGFDIRTNGPKLKFRYNGGAAIVKVTGTTASGSITVNLVFGAAA